MSRLGVRLAVAGVAVAVVVALDSTGWASPQASAVVDDAAQLVAGVLAAVGCAWSATRSVGVERAWRRLMAVGMASWSVGQLVWSWYQIFAETALPSPSLADVGYLGMPVFALAALLAIAAGGRAQSRWQGVPGVPVGRLRLVLVLDGLVVVGSLLILTWYTALGAVVAAGAPTTLAFMVAIAYPTTDVMLVVLVVLLLATRPVSSRLRPQLGLLGLGLVGLSVSDSIFAYLVSSGAEQMPPVANVGFIAGPLLIAIAAVTTGPRPGREEREDRPVGWLSGWAHLLLPYVPLGGICVQMAIQQANGRPFDGVEVYVGVAVLMFVLVRQMITLIDHTVLLGEISRTQQRLRHQAFHDPLTGLANRTLFHWRLEEAIERHRSTHRPTVLFFIDLDDFKLVNDTLGHQAGDRVLQSVAGRLRSCVREDDTVARLGGDEFGILVHGDHDDPGGVGRRVLAALQAPFAMGGHTFTLSASIGVAEPDRAETDLNADRLLRRADAAMYSGKRGGKGVLVVHGDRAASDDQADLLTLLADALSNPGPESGLDVHYQPIVRMIDGACVAVEALARWHHPLLGDVPAADFVAVAERAGLVGRLDTLVLDRACRDLVARPNHDNLAVHVNVSASRLGTPELESTVEQTLRRYGLEPHRLVLEITETYAIADTGAAAASAHRLEKLGVRLALDDFGAGHHSLVHLHRFPIHILKLDRSLTNLHPDRPLALCRSVLTIARDLAITVIAEAVEDRDQAATLAGLGCGYAQGYLYGRPAPTLDSYARAVSDIPAHP